MRFRLVILFSIISLSASAQWLHISLPFKKHHLVLPAMAQVKDNSIKRIKTDTKLFSAPVQTFAFDDSQYSLEAQEKVMLKTVKHNMNWRIYNVASYNFSDLAELYIKMHRLSEAKWYLLQSIHISREENDHKHTITSLMSLALVKDNIGDAVSARADLVEARDMAQAGGMKDKVAEIEKRLPLLGQLKSPLMNKYAEAVEMASKDR